MSLVSFLGHQDHCCLIISPLDPTVAAALHTDTTGSTLSAHEPGNLPALGGSLVLSDEGSLSLPPLHVSQPSLPLLSQRAMPATESHTAHAVPLPTFAYVGPSPAPWAFLESSHWFCKMGLS